MRLTVRQDQMVVMQAVVDANFERQIASHLRESYPGSVVRLPDNGGEFTVTELTEDALERWVRAGISAARGYDMQRQSSIAAFVTLMFDVAPNFDHHRMCEVLLGDEEKPADDRIDDVLTVLNEKNWDAIRLTYDPQAWLIAEQKASEAAAKLREQSSVEKIGTTGTEETVSPVSRRTMSGKTMSGKTLKGKTLTGKTFSRTVSRKSEKVKIQPEISDSDSDFDKNTVKIDRKE